ncbi:unnamed protein product [Orchesella dallaii]|uniref:Lipase domain-containing protein n=1 Tax=Orchesella dallaii TaxID=48710 RepID=A0ABP1RKA4_9HEXA
MDNDPARNFDAVIRRPINLDSHYKPIEFENGDPRRQCQHCDGYVRPGRLHGHVLVCPGRGQNWMGISCRRGLDLVAQGGLRDPNQVGIVGILHDTLDLTLGRLTLLSNSGLFRNNVDESAIENVFLPRYQNRPQGIYLNPKVLAILTVAVIVIALLVGFGFGYYYGKTECETKFQRDIFMVPGMAGGVALAVYGGSPFPTTLNEARKDVGFYLYQNGIGSERHSVDDYCIVSNVNASNNLLVVVHGFHSSPERFAEPFGKAFAEMDYDVLIVDWENLARGPFYLTVKENTPVVGKVVGELLKSLIDYGQTTGNQIEIVCHSIGCAVANFIAHEITRERIGRITGLDPAQPSFESGDPNEQLDASDASFVDIIHSNAGQFSEMKLGMVNDCGHVDFRPNGGSVQPGCENEFFGTCSHSRAIEYYVESVNDPDAFQAFESHSYEDFESGVVTKQKPTKMGFWCSKTSRGKFYLKTRATSPFAVKNEESSWNF